MYYINYTEGGDLFPNDNWTTFSYSVTLRDFFLDKIVLSIIYIKELFFNHAPQIAFDYLMLFLIQHKYIHLINIVCRSFILYR